MSRKLIFDFLRNESGQTTTEYILILAVVVTIIMQFRKKLVLIVNKLLGGIDDGVTKAICFDDPDHCA